MNANNKISKCCNANVRIFKGDMGWNIICKMCGSECEVKDKPKKCRRCKNFEPKISKTGSKLSKCDYFDSCPYGNPNVSTNMNTYESIHKIKITIPTQWWVKEGSNYHKTTWKNVIFFRHSFKTLKLGFS